MSELPAIFCNCGIPWEDNEGFCTKCKKAINPERYKATRRKNDFGFDPCDCGYPKIEQTNLCGRCKKVVPWSRLEMLDVDTEKIREQIIDIEDSAESNNRTMSSPEVGSSQETKSFCVSCGFKLDLQSNFCTNCGNPTLLKSTPNVNSDKTLINKKQEHLNSFIPEAIRLNLSKHQTHRQVTCLECGYVGLMGVIEVIENKASSWPIYLFAGFIGLFGVTTFGPAGLIVVLIVGGLIGAFLGSQDNANRKIRIECPNCMRELLI